jgi:hypothetical protein
LTICKFFTSKKRIHKPLRLNDWKLENLQIMSTDLRPLEARF